MISLIPQQSNHNFTINITLKMDIKVSLVFSNNHQWNFNINVLEIKEESEYY